MHGREIIRIQLHVYFVLVNSLQRTYLSLSHSVSCTNEQ
jgi:hypothetical protein